MRDRDADRLARIVAAVNSDWLFSTLAKPAANEAQPRVAHQRAGQQPASVSTWNPLHIPSTGTPRAAATRPPA